MKRNGKCGRKVGWIVKRYEKYGRIVGWIVIRYEKYVIKASIIRKW